MDEPILVSTSPAHQDDASSAVRRSIEANQNGHTQTADGEGEGQGEPIMVVYVDADTNPPNGDHPSQTATHPTAQQTDNTTQTTATTPRRRITWKQAIDKLVQWSNGGCFGLPCSFVIFLAALSFMALGALVFTIVLGGSIPGSNTWYETSCFVLSLEIQSQCESESCPTPEDKEYRIQFEVNGYDHPGSKPADNETVLAYYGHNDTYWMTYSEANSTAGNFVPVDQFYPCWVNEEQVYNVSMAYVEPYPVNRLAYIFLVITTVCLLLLLIVSLVITVLFVRNRRYREEYDPREGQVRAAHRAVSSAEAAQKAGLKRERTIAFLKSDCVIPLGEAKVLSEQREEPDCPICLDPFLPSVTTSEEVNSAEDIEIADLDQNKTVPDRANPSSPDAHVVGENSVVRIPCGHIFHLDCLVTWVQVGGKRVCPLCHGRIRKKQSHRSQQRANDTDNTDNAETGDEHELHPADDDRDVSVHGGTLTEQERREASTEPPDQQQQVRNPNIALDSDHVVVALGE